MSHLRTETGLSEDTARRTRQSVRAIIGLLKAPCKVASALNVGSGQAGWVSEWQSAGVQDVAETAPAEAGHDYGFSAGRRFDIAQCLDLGGTVTPCNAGALVSALTLHSDIVLFAAPGPGDRAPGQLNVQPLEYWRDLFAAQGYDAVDAVRPALSAQSGLLDHYRFNTLVYASPEGIDRMAPQMREKLLKRHRPVPRRGDVARRMREVGARLMDDPALSGRFRKVA